MKRDTVINVLLIVAGIVLALALFGAGAFWRGKVTPKRSSELHIRSAHQHPAEQGFRFIVQERIRIVDEPAAD